MKNLLIVSMGTVALSGILCELEKGKAFGGWNRYSKQLIIGCCFGIMAVCATRYGVAVDGVIMNVRDAMPVCAGLLFGELSGITAGVMGALYRYFVGAGDFSRIACSLGVILSGLLTALLRRFLFEGRRGGWAYGFGVGAVCEVLHMLLVLLTNPVDVSRAFQIVEKIAAPMILLVGMTVMGSCMVSAALFGELLPEKGRKRKLTTSFQIWLFACVLVAFFSTCFLTDSIQKRIALRESESILKLNLEDVTKSVHTAPGGYVEMLRQAPAMRVGKRGGIIVCNEDLVILSGKCTGSRLGDTDIFLEKTKQQENDCFEATVYGTSSYCMFVREEGRFYIAYFPSDEVMFYRWVSTYIAVFTEILIFAVLFCLIYLLTRRMIVNNIEKINGSLAKITGGNLEEQVNVREYREFASLSDDINRTVGTLKRYIAEAAARIDKELEFARTIQQSALPCVFPPYPERSEFDIFAVMTPAKEVGGDFYDFYFVGPDKLCFLVADVSGKGIGAAMFMMAAKTVIKSLAETGMEAGRIFTEANSRLCEGNESGMFVTAWMGIMELQTGMITYVNAGHNPPVICHEAGNCEYCRARPAFVLAGMDGMNYKSGSMQLAPGDVLFLYTDGVTEALDGEKQMYGEERLKRVLSREKTVSPEELCVRVKADTDNFVKPEPQFDDMTMLTVRWNGPRGK